MAELKMTIDKTNRISKINKEIYGHFAEHLGRCIYGGIFVGEDSPIPNTRGIRNDVIEALNDTDWLGYQRLLETNIRKTSR